MTEDGDVHDQFIVDCIPVAEMDVSWSSPSKGWGDFFQGRRTHWLIANWRKQVAMCNTLECGSYSCCLATSDSRGRWLPCWEETQEPWGEATQGGNEATCQRWQSPLPKSTWWNFETQCHTPASDGMFLSDCYLSSVITAQPICSMSSWHTESVDLLMFMVMWYVPIENQCTSTCC